MLNLSSIISGSSGNCTLVSDGKTNILIDCGASGKRITDALKELGTDICTVKAILVTHEHIDHVRGAGVLARRHKIPIYATVGTHRSMDVGKVDESLLFAVTPDKAFNIGDIDITPFSIPHDAASPCGYSFTDGNDKLALATDIGRMNNYILNHLHGCKSVLLESNHDIDMLRYGAYPYPLKQRILSDIGHLSNAAAAETALELVKSGTEHIMLGHLSEQNNLPEIAQLESFNHLTNNGVKVGTDVTLQIAARHKITKFDL